MGITVPAKVIVNADDFGASAEINHAIMLCFENGLVSSATIMVNMPGFEDACGLAHTRKLLSHIGLHLNLTQGTPLTPGIRRFSRFCSAEGRFVDPRKHKPLVPLSPAEEEALRTEIEAQIAAARSNGVPLTHLDSHHHVHTFWSTGRVIVGVARKLRIEHIRLSRNCGPQIGFVKRVYKTLYNRWLGLNGVAGVKYFGSASDVEWVLSRQDVAPGFSAEIMVHPIFGAGGTIWDACPGVSLAERMRRLPLQLDQIVSYTGQRWHSCL